MHRGSLGIMLEDKSVTLPASVNDFRLKMRVKQGYIPRVLQASPQAHTVVARAYYQRIVLVREAQYSGPDQARILSQRFPESFT